MINAYYFDENQKFHKDLERSNILTALNNKKGVLWVDLEDPTEFESDILVELFNFHPLAVEDCLSDHSEPKVDDYDEYLFIVMHALMMVTDENGQQELTTIELHLFLGDNYVVTFHKQPVTSIAADRALVERKPQAYLGHGSDLLAHALLDHLVDRYMPVVNQYDNQIESLEEEMFKHAGDDFLPSLLQFKQDIVVLRRILGPQRDTVHFLSRAQNAFIKSEHQMYFRDVYDHLFRIYNTATELYENLNSIMQVYFSYSSNKLNAVMKRMTVLATLTMPAIIIASIYGMNFSYMPFLSGKSGFFISLAVMGCISFGMLFWMKKKRWI